MATKQNDPCHDKSADDEPLFTLCARDESAASVVNYWVALNAARLGRSHPKLDEARKIADDMRAWPHRKPAD